MSLTRLCWLRHCPILREPSATFVTVVVGFAPVQLPLMIVEAVVSVAIIRLPCQ